MVSSLYFQTIILAPLLGGTPRRRRDQRVAAGVYGDSGGHPRRGAAGDGPRGVARPVEEKQTTTIPRGS